MQRIFRNVLVPLAIAGATMLVTTARSAAQTRPPEMQSARLPDSPSLDVAVTYGATLSDLITTSNFWMQGGSVQIHGQFYRGLGTVADITGAHTAEINSTGVGLDLVTATFGLRYTWSPSHTRYRLYGQGLVGEAFGMNGVFPNPAGATSTADSLAVKAGGGLDVRLRRRLAVRVFEADYLRTQLPNSTNNVQNNLTLYTGFVFRLR